MAPPKLRKSDKDGGTAKAGRAERRTRERRTGKELRARTGRRDGAGRSIRDLYQSDLDRHLWSWAKPSAKKKRRKERERRVRQRKLARIVASAAGAVGAAGLSYFLYRRLRERERPDDPAHGQADLDEADFED
jgi:hypothetical protein